MTVTDLLLKNTSAHHITKICHQLTANMNLSLPSCVRYEKVDKEVNFEKWIEDVRGIDDYLAEQHAELKVSVPSSRSALSKPSQMQTPLPP